MEKFNEYIFKKLPFLIILVALGTFLSPVYWKVSSWLPSMLLGVVIFFTGLSMNINSITEIRWKKRELILTALLKWIVTVFISIALAYVFFSSSPEIAAGLILSGTVPSATSATVYTFIAGGNTSLVVAASLLDVAISPIITPFSLVGFTSEQVITFSSLLKSFLQIVVLPLGMGLFIQRKVKQSSKYTKNITKLGSSLSLLLIVHTVVGSGKEAISSEIKMLPLIALATFIQIFLPMIISYVTAKKLKVREEDALAILFQVGLCNTALAAILALKFLGELATIAPIMNMIINLSLGAFIANYFTKSESFIANYFAKSDELVK